MYAIRSYYGPTSMHGEPPERTTDTDCSWKWMGGASVPCATGSDALRRPPTSFPVARMGVITSYSIHYTKLSDLAGEYEAIEFYKSVIRLAAELGDSTTRLMMEEITAEEEGHADLWETILQKTGKKLP